MRSVSLVEVEVKVVGYILFITVRVLPRAIVALDLKGVQYGGTVGNARCIYSGIALVYLGSDQGEF